MFKLILVGIAGYIVYRTVKTKVKTMIFGPDTTKEIKAATELIPCEHCGSFTDRTTTFTHHKKKFCSQKCYQSYMKEHG